MIFSHNIISGYLCMQGSFMYHLPMLIAMLWWVDIPNDQDLRLAFQDMDTQAVAWFYIQAFLHLFLAVLHIVV